MQQQVSDTSVVLSMDNNRSRAEAEAWYQNKVGNWDRRCCIMLAEGRWDSQKKDLSTAQEIN